MNSHRNPPAPNNYWNSLSQAFAYLGEDDFTMAEETFFIAEQLRESSPGRVFLTEKIGDRLQRMLRRKDPAQGSEGAAGRWAQRSSLFRAEFQNRADQVVREGLRLAGLRPEDEAHSNQPVLARALYLVSRSRLFSPEPRSAIPLLKGLFRTAQKTGVLFAPDLVRHDLPLTEEDRLWLATKGGAMLESFLEQEALVPGSTEAGEWARAILQLLRREYFGSSGRLEAERSWLEAVSADRLLNQPASCVALYREYLAGASLADPRMDLARLRILEILANVDALHLAAPRYKEARDALGPGLLTSDKSVLARCQEALACMDFRQPGADADGSMAWASVGLEADGSLGIVFWHDDQPRDVAFWFPGGDAGDLDQLLRRSGDRVLALSPEVVRSVGEQWTFPCNRHSAMGLATAVLEPLLPGDEQDFEEFLRLGLAESGAWTRDWTPRLGHPYLQPPSSSENPDSWRQRPSHQALLAGLLVLAMRSRLEAADPSLRAGIRELGRHGDEAAWFLYDIATLGKPAILALDETFASWTLPLLWTRPGPWSLPEDRGYNRVVSDLQPDLGRNDLSIVATGAPSGVLKAWGSEQCKWRVVWDGYQRADHLASLAATVLGPVTLLPPQGTIHALESALALLDEEVGRQSSGDPDIEGLMGLFHWSRLVETHNGDLEDYLEIRGKTRDGIELYGCYGEFVSGLKRVSVATVADDPWCEQYVQRVRKSGLVAGHWVHLSLDANALDAHWGVFDGSDASWVFLDSAEVHRGLLRGGEGYVRNLHTLLCSRGHRHLSLLTGTAWMADAVSSYLEYLLQAFGRAYHLTLQDRCPPVLKLVDKGIRPDAGQLRAEALSSQFSWLQQYSQAHDVTVIVSPQALNGRFWWGLADHQISGLELSVNFLAPDYSPCAGATTPRPETLVLPVLPGFDEFAPDGGEQGDDPCAWADQDDIRNSALAHGLARCALELAGLMSGPWREVVVLDTRWWHLLWGRSVAEGFEQEHWSAAMAQRISGAMNAQLLQLPDTSHPGQELAGTQLAVARWLNSHGQEVVQAPPQKNSGGTHTVILELGAGQEGWRPYASRIEMSREQGQLGAWMLMVAPGCQESWREFVTRDGACGCSVLREGKFPLPPAALVWVQPDQLREPLVLQEILRFPPAVIHIMDLELWLPGAGDARYFAAMALREVLQGSGSRIVLHAESLELPWIEFFQGLLGDRLKVIHPPDQNGRIQDLAGAGVEAPKPSGIEPWMISTRVAHEHLRRMLSGLRPMLALVRGVDPGPNGLVSTHEIASIRSLALFAGLEQQEVAQGVQALTWALGIGGEHLPSASSSQESVASVSDQIPQSQSHGLLIPKRFAELEHTLKKMERDLCVLVPLWLQGLSAGMRTWVDLEHPPVAIAGEDLMRLDALLMSWCGDHQGPGGLVYECPAGSLNSHTRWLGCDGNSSSLVEVLVDQLTRFRLQLSELMDSAVETPGGFLIDTGLMIPGPREREFLALGFGLGFWRWLGPVSKDVFSLVDLLALADVMDKPGTTLAWELCAKLLRRPSMNSQEDAGRSVADSVARAQGSRPSWRNLLSGESRAEQDFQVGIERVSAMVIGGEPGQFVLRGTAGSGRHEALVRGLTQACQQLPLIPGIKIYCPDTAIAAHLSEQFLRWGQGLDFALEIPDGDGVLPDPVNTLPVSSGHTVVVICEAQRFPVDLRYRISQMGRGKLLLVTADLLASDDSWESLFLTAPRPNHILDCQHQRFVSRKIWSAVRDLFPGHELLQGGTSVAERGELSAVHASNLDQCLGRLFAEPDFSGSEACLRIVAGIKGDLDYLGSSLEEKGWAVVYEDQLEAWLNPGPREFLAVLVDLEAKGARSLVPLLIPKVTSLWWSEWCAEHQDLLEMDNLSSVWEYLKTQEFFQPTLAHAAHRKRVLELIQIWAASGPRDLLENSLALAMNKFVSRGLIREPEVQSRPIALLAEALSQPGIFAPESMYLCLGSEHPHRHYQHWSRVRHGLLVLFQEHSPLPGDHGH